MKVSAEMVSEGLSWLCYVTESVAKHLDQHLRFPLCAAIHIDGRAGIILLPQLAQPRVHLVCGDVHQQRFPLPLLLVML